MGRMGKTMLFTLWLVCMQAVAADKPPEWKPLDVPQQVSTEQKIANTPVGWTSAKEDLPNRLSSITISEGPPEDKVLLVYDDLTKHKDKSVATWKFDAESKEKYWISCSYSGTNIMIKKPLPDGIKELRIFYDDEVKTAGMSTVEKIEYR